jgi:hypothetical protein
MADSVDKEYDSQPSIYKNANILQSSGAQTAVTRRPGRGSPKLSLENTSEDETEAQPQKTFRQTAGLRDRSRTELRSSDRRRTAPGGNRFSSFKNSERAHPRRSVGNIRDMGLRKAAREDSRQVDRDTISDRSYSNVSDIVENTLASKPSIASGSARPRRLTSDIGIDIVIDHVTDRRPGRPPSNSPYRSKDSATPSTYNDSLPASSVLLPKFSSISHYTISKDKTQGEEAHNSELLAAFGKKIQGRVFGENSNQSITLAVHQSPPPKISTHNIRNLTTSLPSSLRPLPPGSTYDFRMTISGLPSSLTFEALKTFVYQSGLEFIIFDRGRGVASIDFKTFADRRAGIERLNGREFRGGRVNCYEYIPSGPPPPSARGSGQ